MLSFRTLLSATLLLAFCTVTAGFLGSPPARSGAGFTLPIEVFPPDGGSAHTKAVSVNLPDARRASTLYLQCHACGYEKSQRGEERGYDAKASVRVNSGAWQPLSNANADVYEHERAYEGIGGAFSVVRMELSIDNFRGGENRVEFRFNGTEGVSSGYRIIDLDVTDVGGQSLLAAAPAEVTPSTWTAPDGYDTPSAVAAGRRLWHDASLRESPLNAERLEASCAGCHAADGRDLKYFNFSNESIVGRSRFHGLTPDEGKKIAAYIRAVDLNLPAGYDVDDTGRPWNPPYQPGPGLEDRPVELWAAGAGIDAVLERDEDMAPYIMDEVHAGNADVHGQIEIVGMPVAVQFPDWNEWLPDVHPFDAYGKNRFKNERQHQAYAHAADVLRTQPRSQLIAAAREEAGGHISDGGLIELLEPITYNTSDPSYDEKPGLDKFVAAMSHHQWSVVKTWELHQKYKLEDLGEEIFDKPGHDIFYRDRAWLQQQKQSFMVAPHMNSRPEYPAGGPFATEDKNNHMSRLWYQVQLTLSGGQRMSPGDNGPMDWQYHFNHITGSNSRASRTIGHSMPPLAAQVHSEIVAMQTEFSRDFTLDKADGSWGRHNWAWRRVNPTRLLWDYDYWENLTEDYDPALRKGLLEAYLRPWLDEALTHDPEEWARERRSKGGRARGTALPSMDYTPDLDGTSTTRSGMRSYQPADNVLRAVPRLKSFGLKADLIKDWITWGEQMWPRGDWDALREDLNIPPVVHLTAPVSGAALNVPRLTLRAEASDEDGAIERITFLADGAVLGQATRSGRIFTYDWNDVPANSYRLTAVAVDDQGATATSDPVQVTVENVVEIEDTDRGDSDSIGDAVFAVNAGGEAFADADGQPYQADTGFEGGKTYTRNSAIAGTDADALYQSERYGDFSYAIPLEDGAYEVVFRFAEIYHENEGQRVFDVDIENEERISDLDLFAQVGANAAYDVTKTVEVSDGELNVVFSGDVRSPKLSALLVRQVDTGDEPAVTRFVLVNAETNEDLRPLADGDVLNLSALPTEHLTVRADVAGSVGSVRFALNGDADYKTESIAPYALAGDSPRGDYNDWSLSLGAHTLAATPYDGSGARGAEGQSLAVSFTITEGPAVTRLMLVNAETNEDLRPLADGDVLNLSALPTEHLTVRADVAGSVGSVRFALNGDADYKTESIAPYALAGDSPRGDYNDWSLSLGAHTLAATPYDGSGARGAEGDPLSVSFTITEGPAVTRLMLVNAETNEDLRPLADGDVLNLSALPTEHLTVRADVAGPVGSVRFALNGDADRQTESKAPYALAGDRDGDYHAWSLAPGRHTLAAIPHKRPGGDGEAGAPFTVRFTLSEGPGQNTVEPDPAQTQQIALVEGWNLISSRLTPSDARMEKVFQDAASSVVLVKDEEGRIYMPAHGVNDIGVWDVQEAYQVFTTSTSTLQIEGKALEAEAPTVALHAGWNFMPYLEDAPRPIAEVLAPVGSSLVFAKNNAGQSYIPAYGIDDIGMMQPGQGYKVYVSDDALLAFAPAPASAGNSRAESAVLTQHVPAHSAATSSGPNASAPLAGIPSSALLLVEDANLREGDLLTVHGSDNRSVGEARFVGGMAALLIRGDEQATTNVVEGARPGEALTLTARSGENAEPRPVVVEALEDVLTGQPSAHTFSYQEEALHTAKLTLKASSFTLGKNTPNPFSQSTTLHYALPERAHVRIDVYDALGRRVASLVDASKNAGTHRVRFDGARFASGTYFCRFQAGGASKTQRMTLVK